MGRGRQEKSLDFVWVWKFTTNGRNVHKFGSWEGAETQAWVRVDGLGGGVVGGCMHIEGAWFVVKFETSQGDVEEGRF